MFGLAGVGKAGTMHAENCHPGSNNGWSIGAQYNMLYFNQRKT